MHNKRILKPRGRENIPNELISMGRNLVYSEGTKTEPNYINEIKQLISEKYNCKSSGVEIITVPTLKTKNTIELFEYAKNDVANRIAKQETINNVWIFFDKDDFTKKNFESAHNMIIEMNNSKSTNVDGFFFDTDTGISWHSCYSNECFELWLCEYFSYYSSKNGRKDYTKFINKQIAPDVYKKNMNNIHATLIKHGGSLETAIINSKRLNKLNGIDNPSTGVVDFIEFIKPYLE